MFQKELYFKNDEIEEFYKSISNNVRKLREENGISQRELALGMGIKSVAFYSNCECCRYGKHFNLEHIYKISKLFNVEISKILSSKALMLY